MTFDKLASFIPGLTLAGRINKVSARGVKKLLNDRGTYYEAKVIPTDTYRRIIWVDGAEWFLGTAPF